MDTASLSVDQTGQLAQNLAGFDPGPVIAAAEQGLLDFLSTPIQQILGGLGLQRLPEQPSVAPADPQPTAAPADAQGPADLAGLANQINPLQFLGTLLDGFGALGNGGFPGFDPTQILAGISNTLDGATTGLQQALGSVGLDWQGGSSAAADEKTRAAIGNGAEVATQADGLRDNLSVAAANVAQARTQMIDIIDEYQAKIAAIDSSGLSEADKNTLAIAAADDAHTESTAVMQALQGTLGVQSEQVSTIGTPVQVTSAPGAGGSLAGGLLSPLRGLAGLDPTGVLSTIVSDPRLTPQGLTGNFMDLLFLPQTATELNQGIKETNSTMARTNTIMAGLGNTLAETNSTLGRTNNIMTGLGKTLHTSNALLSDANALLPEAIGAINTASGRMDIANGLLAQANDLLGGDDGAIYWMKQDYDAMRDGAEITQKAGSATQYTGAQAARLGDDLEQVLSGADAVQDQAEAAQDWLKQKEAEAGLGWDILKGIPGLPFGF